MPGWAKVGAWFGSVTVQTNERDALSAPSLTVTVTLKVPAVVSVPLMRPVAPSSVTPGGSPASAYVRASPFGSLPSSCSRIVRPITDVRSPGSASVGGSLTAGSTVHVNDCEALSTPSLAVAVTL